MTVKEELKSFIPYTLAQREVSLIMTEGDANVFLVSKELAQEEFIRLSHPRELTESGKHFVILTQDNAKELYDMVVQYSTGQVTLFDQTSHASRWITPLYKESSLIILATKEIIQEVENSGLTFRTVTGLTLQL